MTVWVLRHQAAACPCRFSPTICSEHDALSSWNAPMSGRIRLRQHLTIVDLTHRRDQVDVHVRTVSGERGRIRFQFIDQATLSAQLTRLRRWMHTGTSLTYVAGPADSALIDDRANFEAAFGGLDHL